VFRALVALGRDLSTGDLAALTWPRRQRPFRPVHYERIRSAAAEIADPIGRSTGQGRPWLWRLREDARLYDPIEP
jgi:hypothetical protein